MPATEDVWRNLRTMHVVFAASAVALFGSTWLMMDRDYADEWRPIQKVAARLQADQIVRERNAITSQTTFEEQEVELEKRIDAAKTEVEQHKVARKAAKSKSDELDGQYQLLSRQVKDERAYRDKARADLDIAVRDGKLTKEALQPFQNDFDQRQAKVDEMEAALEHLQTRFDEAKSELSAMNKVLDDAMAAKKKHDFDLARLEKALAQIAPSKAPEKFKHWLMELPIIDGLNGPFKINQLWMPDLKVPLGGMTEVARFDRCNTCHVNIDRVGTGNVASFPHDAHGITMANVDEYVGKKDGRKRIHDDGSAVGYGHPFSTHPNPDLFLTSASPHPMQKFGCTSCHEGQGSGTSFQNASHTPSAPDIGEEWRQKYGYASNHYWEYPMYPKRLAEAACIKCHHNVVELGVHPKFGASAPKAYRGYEVIRQYGCYGCHEINGYSGGKQIGPDMRLEPQTAEEAERIAADPTSVAGTMRKVGPGLRHFAAKTNKAWAENWVKEPKAFRPDTRMPQFFDLNNQRDAHAKELQPVEIAGIVAYLFEKSEPLKLDEWAADYTPDAQRGKKLFSQRGCLACHSHADFPRATQDFGPNLTNVHQKLTSLKWLYTWIREPTHHSSRTKMPNLFVEPETVQGVTTDPAADIAAFLMSNRDAEGKLPMDADKKSIFVLDTVGPGRFESIAWGQAGLRELVELYLKKSVGGEKTKVALEQGRLPESELARIKAAAIEPDEVELVAAGITPETMLRYVGRRTISRYGCYGCHDIPGFEKARPVGTALQDWGRKDPTKLALEHIEEYLHHHGEPDGSSTAERAERALKDGLNGNLTPAQEATEGSVGFFFSQLLQHGRAGFLWQKLRDPRSYDYKKIETKNWDERLRMPRFPFNESDIEAVATFVLGLVAEPPMEKYQYRPHGAAKARVNGEKLIAKFNCAGCHMLELPEIEYRADELEFRLDISAEKRKEFAGGKPVAVSARESWEAIRALLEGSAATRPYVRLVDSDELLALDLSRLDQLSKSLRERAGSPVANFIEPEILIALHDKLWKDFAAPYEKRQQPPPDAGVDDFYRRFNDFLRQVAFFDIDAADHPEAMDLLMRLKPPHDGRAGMATAPGEVAVRFHGLINSAPDPEDDPADQEAGYDLWETLQVGQKGLLPGTRITVPVPKQISVTAGRGGAFAEWLVNASMAADRDVNRDKAREMAPPPLYLEGIKVQTPWLYAFLKNPGKLRYTTVLRMPQFNMSSDEAQTLADYFAAVDGAAFPYQDVPQREPEYLRPMEAAHADYLGDAWKVVTKAPPAGFCAGCHAVGGREFIIAGDPTKVTRGPNLDGVYNRLRPDWMELWISKPKSITPYTAMPQNFVRDKQVYPELFHGDGREQIVAARDALMNYLRLLEKEGKATAAAPAAAPAEPPAADAPPAETSSND
ncbi:MAG: c-type cytochrome [Planctomycetaceae bacterium]|nr:c-type cytochrome [Planctomycetaceae bacterium]